MSVISGIFFLVIHTSNEIHDKSVQTIFPIYFGFHIKFQFITTYPISALKQQQWRESLME